MTPLMSHQMSLLMGQHSGSLDEQTQTESQRKNKRSATHLLCSSSAPRSAQLDDKYIVKPTRFELTDFFVCRFALDILPRERSRRDIPAIRLPIPGCLSVTWHMHFHGVMVRRHSQGKSQRILQSKPMTTNQKFKMKQN